jgi:TRAP-type C4-dicarboxylate transport system substrate-binding protein
MKTILRIATAATLLIMATAAQAETRLTMSSWLPSGHPLVSDVMKPWIASVEEATEGRVKIIMLPSPLGHPKVHYDIARQGQADITYSAHGYTPGRFKLYKMVEFPFSGDSAEATSVAYWNVYNTYLKSANEHKGVKLLSLFTHGPGHIHNSKRTVNSASDMEGLKLRVGGGIMNDISSELGAVTLQKPSSSIYELLSNGVADGTLFPLESIAAFKVEDMATHTTLIPGGMYNFSFFLVMNRDRFASLPKEDQVAIESVSGEVFARLAGRMWDAEDAKGLEVLKANGNEIVTANEAFMTEIRNASAPMEAEWLKTAKEVGVDGEAALKAFREESHKRDVSQAL